MPTAPVPANGRNPEFIELPRSSAESNVDWLARASSEVRGSGTYVVLLGGRRAAALRLRVAQSHVRHDMTPSHWHHAVLLQSDGQLDDASRGWHVPMEPDMPLGFPPGTNGVQEVRLDAFQDATTYPNIALLSIPVDLARIHTAVATFAKHRTAMDLSELLAAWLAYSWGVGRSENPLAAGLGIPAGVMIEAVMAAAGIELSPNMPTRGTCPEIFWQAATWWHKYYESRRALRISADDPGAGSSSQSTALSGRHIVADRLVPV